MDQARPDPGELTHDIAPDLIDEPDASPLEVLRRAAEEQVAGDDEIVKPVPRRPGYAVRYTIDGLDPGRMQSINQRATNRKTGRVDNDTVHCLLLAHQCTGLMIGDQWITEGGRPLRFADSAVRAALGVDTAADAVRVFYGGRDRKYGFALMQHNNELLTAAGFTDVLGTDDDVDDDEDPTPATR